MTLHRLALALTAANALLLVFLLGRASYATSDTTPQVLRARSLEVVDDRGRVRASIKIQTPDDSQKRPDGSPYPETVMLRLIDPNGRPEVKLGASVDGAGLGLVGKTDDVHLILQAEGTSTQLVLAGKDKRQVRLAP